MEESELGENKYIGKGKRVNKHKQKKFVTTLWVSASIFWAYIVMVVCRYLFTS